MNTRIEMKEIDESVHKAFYITKFLMNIIYSEIICGPKAFCINLISVIKT